MKSVALLSVAALAWALAVNAEPEGSEPPTSLHAFEARRLSGPVESLADYRGQVLLVVNTASRCGLTPQYEGLQTLYSRYRARGFQVLGFPSNDFREQEPGSDAEIGAFCRTNYGVEFPMFSKVKVLGPEAHPLYGWLRSRPDPIGGDVEWNFQKYLADRDGRVVARFSPRTPPLDDEITRAIEQLLDADAPAP